MNILHPIQSLQKWALINLLKGIVKDLPIRKEQLNNIWRRYSDEICEKVEIAIEQIVVKVIKKAMERENISFLDSSDN